MLQELTQLDFQSSPPVLEMGRRPTTQIEAAALQSITPVGTS
jgi:hypothetical protein